MKSKIAIYFLAVTLVNLFGSAAPNVVRFASSVENSNVGNDLDTLIDIVTYALKNLLWTLDPSDCVLKLGYPMVETEFVTTEDDYELPLVRIAFKRAEKIDRSKQKPAVLFMHGISSSSAELQTVGLNKSLVLQLVDQGYDVYIGNNRGNMYSKHKTLSQNDAGYWNFSFEEMATRDLPAIIEHVLKWSRNKKITYVGYSQGATQLFTLLAEKPEYNEKLLLVNALAPLVYMENVSSQALRFATDYKDLLEVLFNDNREILRHNQDLSLILGVLCMPSLKFKYCPKVIYETAGYSPDQFDWSYLPLFFETYPGGLGLKTLLHYVQEIKSGRFRKYDYGKEQNIQRYGQASPPDYNLSNVKAPVAVFYGKSDSISTVKDVEKLISELPPSTVVHQQLVKSEYFNHFDFLAGKQVSQLVNRDVIALINKHNGREQLAL